MDLWYFEAQSRLEALHHVPWTILERLLLWGNMQCPAVNWRLHKCQDLGNCSRHLHCSKMTNIINLKIHAWSVISCDLLVYWRKPPWHQRSPLTSMASMLSILSTLSCMNYISLGKLFFQVLLFHYRHDWKLYLYLHSCWRNINI